MSAASPDDSKAASLITGDAFLALVYETIPRSRGFDVSIEAITRGFVRMRLAYDPLHLRAGGTISGPTIMTLADTVLYAMVLSLVGLEPLAVTTDLSFHFMKKPAARDLIADARVLRHGKTLIIGDVTMHSDGDDALVAHAVGSYAVPKRA